MWVSNTHVTSQQGGKANLRKHSNGAQNRDFARLEPLESVLAHDCRCGSVHMDTGHSLRLHNDHIINTR